MQTTVFKEILDKSLPGDKIFGGDIDSVDSIVASLLVGDAIRIPNTGFAGTGTIDGNGISVGLNAPLSYLASKAIVSYDSISGGTGFSLYGTSHLLAKMAHSGGIPELIVNTAVGAPFLKISSGDDNYIDGVLIVGSTTEIPVGAGYKLQVQGHMRATGSIRVGDSSMTSTRMESGDARFDDVGGNVWLSDWYDEYALVKGEVDGLPAGLSSLTAAEITQLSNIDSNTMSTTTWGRVSAMQNVATSASVLFAAATIASNFILAANGILTYDAPTSGARFYSDISGNIYLKGAASSGGMSIAPSGVINIANASALASSGSLAITAVTGMTLSTPGILGLTGNSLALTSTIGNIQFNYAASLGMYVQPNGSVFINTAATGLKFASNTATGAAEYKHATTNKGWSLSSIGDMTIDDLTAPTLSSTNAGITNLTVGGGDAIAKIFKVARTPLSWGSVPAGDHSIQTITVIGVVEGDTVILDVDRTDLTGTEKGISFAPQILSNDIVSVYAINATSGGISVAAEVGLTIIKYL